MDPGKPAWKEEARVSSRARESRKWVTVYTWSKRGAGGLYTSLVSVPSCRKVTIISNVSKPFFIFYCDLGGR
jgi:hypothetical protein